MGTSLTGLTPATTYDALIKVGNNGPIDGTLKTLSDGLGNDLPMQVSTSAINFTATLTQSGVALQPVLVSGTNIKTDNSTSMLGSGNISVTATPAGSTSEVQFKRLGLGAAVPLGILHLKVSAGATRQVIDGDAGQNKIITFRTAGLQRWGLYSNNVAESGSNAGSNFVLRRYNDAGTLLGTPIQFNRATGLTTISEGLDLGGSVLNNFIPNQASTSVSLTLDSTNTATYNSSVIALTGALTINFDASLPNGFNVTLIQLNAATSTITGTGGLIIGNRQGHTKNNGQYSVVSIIKYTNVLAILGGDTSV